MHRLIPIVAALALLAVPSPAAAAETVDPAEDVYAFGDARFLGSTGALDLQRPIVDMAATPSGAGYWLVASDGGIFSYGDAPFLGSTGAIDLNEPIVGMAATPSGRGYWLVASDGGVFTFGDAPFLGSAGAIDLNEPIVGLAVPDDGDGYWLVASDGGIFSYGDAPFLGSAGAIDLNEPIVDMAAAEGGDGYWFVARDGGIFNYGATAGFHGAAADDALTKPITALEATPTGDGYWMAAVGVRVCRHPGFVVLYPARWHVAEGAVPPCRYFDPEPVTVSGHAADRPKLAVSMTILANVSFDEVAAPDPDARELSRERTAVDGHRAVVIEQVATGEGLYPRGTFTYEYLVEVDDDRVIQAQTHDTDDTADTYRSHKQVLDDMMRDLEVR